jgi:hypothetical protein
MAGKEVLDRFVEQNPIAVMTRAIIVSMMDADTFDQIFEDNRSRQYDSTIKFSVLALTMAEIALGTKRNRNQAYIKYEKQIGATKEAYYTKLNRTEPVISEAVVDFSAGKASEMLGHLGFQPWEVVPGYQCYSIDGNHLQKTEKRVTETRFLSAAPLPGTIVARFNHQTSLFDKAYLLEDGHAQEATVLNRVVEDTQRNDLLMADRHYCITHFFFSVAAKEGCFLIRQNSSLQGELIGKRKRIGTTDTGQVYEQPIRLRHNGQEMVIRRVTVELYEPTRDGDMAIHLLCNLPANAGSACVIADAYLQRWEIENAFHILTMTLTCEINSNCYPRCSLLLFCMAMFAYNARQILLAALYSEHAAEDVDRMSQYQISVDTIEPMPGMLTAINEEEWKRLVPATPKRLAAFLRRTARSVDVKRYRASVRGPKKPKPPRKRCKTGTHVSTAKILKARKERC